MKYYRLAEQELRFPTIIPELEPFEITKEAADEAAPFVPHSFRENDLIAHTQGWVGGAQRGVEVYASSHGLLLKIEGAGGFFIAPHGETICKQDAPEQLTKLDREIMLGPALVLALALRGIWSLHASAALYKEKLIVFLGESGQGKSTLAAYLSQSTGWRLIADDILPVKSDQIGVSVLPHYPQLKLPIDAQPGVNLPEHLPLDFICVLAHAQPDQMPELDRLSSAQGGQTLLRHIAGTRMFNPSLLAKHLEFSMQVAKQVPTYRLIHPHRRDTLPLVQEFLEMLC